MSCLKKRKVLVLNKGWSAIGVVSLERALTMLFVTYKDGTPKAKIVDPTKEFQTFTWADWSKLIPKSSEDCIKGVNYLFRIPEVILLSQYGRLPHHKIHFSRRTLYKRDNNRCQYCGCTPGTEELTIDHITPRSRGGKTTWENCVLACVACNSKKANRTPEECGFKLLTQPKKPMIRLTQGDIKVKSWETFLGEAYWNVVLDNDN